MNIAEIEQKSTPIMRSYGVKRASVFGSTARGDQHARSDVDLLVRFGRPMGLITYARFVDELKDSLQRDIDVITEDSLNQHLKPFVMEDAKVIYEEN